MAYRNRKRQSQKKMELMRKAKERKRQENAETPFFFDPPMLRRKIIIIDYDFGEVRHEINCYRSKRIDSYEVHVDGKLHENMGWSKICNLQRQSFIRVGRFD